MKKLKIWISIAGLSMALTLSACNGEVEDKSDNPRTAMLMDETATPAPHRLIRLQERPVFPVDENKLPIAMLEDSGDKPRPSDKPVELQEAKPQ